MQRTHLNHTITHTFFLSQILNSNIMIFSNIIDTVLTFAAYLLGVQTLTLLTPLKTPKYEQGDMVRFKDGFYRVRNVYQNFTLTLQTISKNTDNKHGFLYDVREDDVMLIMAATYLQTFVASYEQGDEVTFEGLNYRILHTFEGYATLTRFNSLTGFYEVLNDAPTNGLCFVCDAINAGSYKKTFYVSDFVSIATYSKQAA